MTTLAGYRRLTKRDFALSKMAAFGLVSRQKVLLARRPVTRRFALVGRRAVHFDVCFLTDAQMVARDAVHVQVTYRPAFSARSLKTEEHQLFADPHAAQARRQRVWLCPPRGARFADVAFARRTRGQKVALDGVLRLAAGQAKPSLSDLDAVLSTYDLTAMSLLLSEAENTGDRATAQRLLARMQLLSHSHDIFTGLSNLREAIDLERFGVTSALRGQEALQGDPDTVFDYGAWASPPASAGLPLLKRVRAEALALHALMEKAGAGTLHIPPGDRMLARMLAAALLRTAAPLLKINVDWHAFRKAPQHYGPWLRYDSGASFLATEGGKTVQSVLLGDAS